MNKKHTGSCSSTQWCQMWCEETKQKMNWLRIDAENKPNCSLLQLPYFHAHKPDPYAEPTEENQNNPEYAPVNRLYNATFQYLKKKKKRRKKGGMGGVVPCNFAVLPPPLKTISRIEGNRIKNAMVASDDTYTEVKLHFRVKNSCAYLTPNKTLHRNCELLVWIIRVKYATPSSVHSFSNCRFRFHHVTKSTW